MLKYFVYIWNGDSYRWETYGAYIDRFTAASVLAKLLKWGKDAYMEQDFEL